MIAPSAGVPQDEALAVSDVDWLAALIRLHDGKHDKGAGALAEALWPHIADLLRGARAEALQEAIATVIEAAPSLNAELRYDGTEDPLMAAYVDGFREAWQALDSLAARADHPAPDHREQP